MMAWQHGMTTIQPVRPADWRFFVRQRRSLVAADIAAAAALTVGALIQLPHDLSGGAVAVSLLAGVACTTSVAWRRFRPTLAAVVAAVGLLVYQLVSSDSQMTFEPYAVVLCYYAAGRLIQTRRRFTLAVVVAVGVGALAGTLAHAGKGQLGSVIGGALLFAILPCAAGTFIARRAALTEELAENSRQLELEQRLLASAVLGAERARIARELHDVIAHCVSVMVIQAGAARLVIGRDRGIALDAARVIEASGREAIDGIRHITGARRREKKTVRQTATRPQRSGEADRACHRCRDHNATTC